VTSSLTKKPFYYQPPWNILFELHKLERVQPWGINLSFLLRSFLDEMGKQGEVDFRASGMVLDSSATIYLMKSKLLLELEEPPLPPKPPPDFLPPPLFQPLRYELTSTTIQNLLEALDAALKGESLFTLKPRLESILPPPPEVLPPIDLYLMETEKQMKKLYRLLLQLVDQGKLVVFSKIIAGLEKLEAIKTFIVLLFLAQKGKVTLWQEEEFGDIYITLMEGSTVEY